MFVLVFLLMIPVVGVVTRGHRILQRSAPTNRLARHVRTSSPSWWWVWGLLALAYGAAFGAHVAVSATAAEGSGEWNLVAAILAWDAIKLLCLAVFSLVRCMRRSFATVVVYAKALVA